MATEGKLAASKIYSQEEEPENDEPHCSKSLFDQQEKEQPFEVKRKLHYNEGMNIKLARQLISKDFDDDEETLPENNEDNTPAEESNEGAATDELQTRSCQV
uniref:Protein phosphatase 1 regulatory inhibitor subunit 2 n=1 Tax=Suricata suricatta TaxID=37032 RepID=A0A673V9I2_SURSU